jgi:hypothetical protein
MGLSGYSSEKLLKTANKKEFTARKVNATTTY